MSPMGSVEVVELLLVRTVRSLNLAIQLRRSRLDVNMADAIVIDVPVELGLPLVASICSDRMDSEWELVDDVVHEVDGIGLCVTRIDLQSPDSGRIIDGCVLIPTHLAPPPQ